ncbi:uncharacterized protein [Dermacentor andersoni]|uniref:uncharacterized protein n=1 Tax=Dermacentor andersoni TaxID=34620 RepID=UPI003B3B0CD0
MASPRERRAEQPQPATPPMAPRSWRSLLPRFSIAPRLRDLMRNLRIRRRGLPRPVPAPAGEGSAMVAASQGTSAGPVASEHSSFLGQVWKLVTCISPRQRGSAQSSVAEIDAMLAEPADSDSIGEERAPADSVQSSSGPQFSGVPGTARADSLYLPGPSGVNMATMEEDSMDYNFSDSSSMATTQQGLTPDISSDSPLHKPQEADPQSIEASCSSTSGRSEPAEPSKGLETQPCSDESTFTDEQTDTTFSFAVPSVTLALAPNRPKPISLIPEMHHPEIPPITSGGHLSGVIADRVNRARRSLRQLINIRPFKIKPKPLPEARTFSSRMWQVCRRYYPHRLAAAEILDRLAERLGGDSSSPAHVVKNPICTHDDTVACWLLGYQEIICSILLVLNYEVVENERQCLTLQHFESILQSLCARVPHPNFEHLEALTFLFWIMERHRCIDSISMGHIHVIEPLGNINLLDMITFAGKLVTARIGVGSHRLPRGRGIFGDIQRLSFITLFQDITTLRELYFFGLHLDRQNDHEREILAVIGNNRSLRTLHFLRCIFSLQLISDLVDVIAESEKLEDVRLDMETIELLLLHDEALRRLGTPKTNLKRLAVTLKDGLSNFLGAMESTSHLTHLDIHNRTESATLEGLSDALSPDSSIRHLTISLNLVDPQVIGDMNIVRKFAKAIENTKLKVLTLPNSSFALNIIRLLGDALAANTEMRELDLSKAHLRCDLALELVERVLKRNRTLWELKLGELRSFLVAGETVEQMVSSLDVLDYIVKNTPILDRNATPEFGPEASNVGHVWISKVYYAAEAQKLLELLCKRLVFRRIELDFSDISEGHQDYCNLLLSSMAEYQTLNIEVFSLKTKACITEDVTIGLALLIVETRSLTAVTVELSYESSEKVWDVLLGALALNINISVVRIYGFLQTKSTLASFHHMCATNRSLRQLEINIQQDKEKFIQELPNLLSECYTLTEFQLTVGELRSWEPVTFIRKLLRRNLLMINMGVAAIIRHSAAPHGGGLAPSEWLGGQSSAWAVDAATKHPQLKNMVAIAADCSLEVATRMVRDARLSVKNNILRRATVFKGERPTQAHRTQAAGFHRLDVESVQRISTYLSSFDIRLRKDCVSDCDFSLHPLWLLIEDTRRTHRMEVLRHPAGAPQADTAASGLQEVHDHRLAEAAAVRDVVAGGPEAAGQDGAAHADTFAIINATAHEVQDGEIVDEEVGDRVGDVARNNVVLVEAGNEGAVRGITPGIHEAGVHEAGVHEAGVHEAGVHEAGVHEAGVHEAGVHEAGVHEAGVHEAGVHEAGVHEAGVHEAGVHEAGVHEAGVHEAGVHEAGVHEAGVHEAGVHEAGVHEAGVHEAGVHEAGVHEAGVHEAGVHEAGVHEAGVHEAGVHEAGVHEAGVHEAGVHEAGVHEAGVHEAGVHEAGVHEAGVHEAGVHEREEILEHLLQ